MRPPSIARALKVTHAKGIGKGALVGSFDGEMPWGLKLTGAMLLEMGAKHWVTFPSFAEFVSPAARERFHAEVLPLAVEALR